MGGGGLHTSNEYAFTYWFFKVFFAELSVWRVLNYASVWIVHTRISSVWNICAGMLCAGNVSWQVVHVCFVLEMFHDRSCTYFKYLKISHAYYVLKLVIQVHLVFEVFLRIILTFKRFNHVYWMLEA